MKFLDYIRNHHVFTTSELYASMDSKAAAEEQLRLAVKSGTVERVRRGLLVSNRGRFDGVSVDQTEIVAAVDSNAVISYHSALEAHGVAHNAGFVCYFRSDTIHTKFEFHGITYQPCGSVNNTKYKILRSAAGTYRATSREQTLIDCLARPALAGGIEEAIRSLTAFVYLDVDELVTAATSMGPSMTARVGWLLSMKATEWHVDEKHLTILENTLGAGPYRLHPVSAKTAGWSAQWKLLLPATSEEVESWITRL